jgi:hypothetical protein
MPRRGCLFLLGVCLALACIGGLGLGYRTLPVQAASASLQATSSPGVSNDLCLACHGQPGQTLTLPNGEIVDLYVAPEVYAASVHGEGGYACVQCHTEISGFPHPALTAQSARQLTLQYNLTCQLCHAWVFERQENSVHARALAENQAAATCVDCHGAHNIRRYNDPLTREDLPEARLSIPKTCANCHLAIYQKYAQSVHGAALTDHQNQDVPTCIDCHGVHDIQDPTSAVFRLQSPSMCARCHTDEKKMAKYGLSTYVMSSYVSDFHGTTVMLFDEQSPDAETNKAVCYDCHGIHDISRTKDPVTGLQLQENLLVRCQECHPGATANFPTAWLSHYKPSPDKYPIVYYMSLFYSLFVPGTLGGMGLLVALDVGRRTYERLQRSRKAPPAAAPAPPLAETLAEAPPAEAAAEPAPLEAATPTEAVAEPELLEEAPPVEAAAEPEQIEETLPAEAAPEAPEAVTLETADAETPPEPAAPAAGAEMPEAPPLSEGEPPAAADAPAAEADNPEEAEDDQP